MKNEYSNDPLEEQEAKEIFEALNKGTVKNVDHAEQIIKELKEAVNNKKLRHKMTIGIPEIDLLHLKQQASDAGLAYQTYIISQLHKLAEGRLKEVDK